MSVPRRSVAIVGSGIAGLTVAEGLYRHTDITVYEAESWVGGHTHTVDVDDDGQTVRVDTGFIVCNEWTYPHFLALLGRYGIRTQNSNMSFSVRDERTGLEYNGTNVNTLFAQRRNALSPGFIGMIADILRFNRAAPSVLAGPDPGPTLGAWLGEGRYGRRFVEHYILPMGRAIWSAQADAMLNFPAKFFVDFFQRHGFLNIDNRPVWQAIPGGSSRYVEAITAGFTDRIRTRTPVTEIRRRAEGVELRLGNGESVHHDAVVIATHADTALSMLSDPSPEERALLGAFPFEPNEVVLHTDERLLPRTALARAAWNYQIRSDRDTGCTLTYDMNILQSLRSRKRYLVSLNLSDRIDPSTVLGRWTYAHPVYTPDAVAAQRRHAQISGVRNTYYAGAYWRYGFHEDGVVSGLRVLDQLGVVQG
jgi:uncharacterized protein